MLYDVYAITPGATRGGVRLLTDMAGLDAPDGDTAVRQAVRDDPAADGLFPVGRVFRAYEHAAAVTRVASLRLVDPAA